MKTNFDSLIKRYRSIRLASMLAATFILFTPFHSGAQNKVIADHKVTLKESHVGNLDIDTRLLDSYGSPSEDYRNFYLEARKVFSQDKSIDFTHSAILEAAAKFQIKLMGGPILGDLKTDGVKVWLRPASSAPLKIKVTNLSDKQISWFVQKKPQPGVVTKINLEGLSSNTEYKYQVYTENQLLASGAFNTAPESNEKQAVRITFGSCFHKIGLHNPNLINTILQRNPEAMMLLGDIAVDDREDDYSMHRSDYLLRDVSNAWRKLASNVPLYTTWDDHDYLNNDLSGVPDRFDEMVPGILRSIWEQNWNNPNYVGKGIYFSTRIGPVELIMLDTRSCRDNEERGQYGSYLGIEQMNWLKKTLANSTAPFKIISSGTMWSDYVTRAKDTWGSWDTEGREEIFSLIEAQNVSGVLLISGDRHGARGFTIPRPSGFSLYEFEAGSLGGVKGPDAMAEDASYQLFGYRGKDAIAFGEFTFDWGKEDPLVTFRLIDQFGKIMEEHKIQYDQLTP